MTTVYTFHRAEDNQILTTAEPGNLQAVAANVARSLATSGDRQTRRAYVHNGRGIIAAGICHSGTWQEVMRADYQHLDPDARLKRTEAGLANEQL